MIEELLDVLAEAGLEPEPRELRDALWLTQHLRVGPARPGPTPEGTGTAEVSAPLPGSPAPPPDRPAEGSPAGGAPAGTAELYAAGTPDGGTTVRATEARSPAVPALRRQLELARALRPLKRRVPSRTAFVVDENATATRVAEEGVWVPVLRPAPVRGLDLALVVDASASMVVWRRTIDELRTFAERLGAFRTVRVFEIGIREGFGGRPAVWPRSTWGGRGLPWDPTTLADPTRRQAILVVTDGVSHLWRDERMSEVLAGWAARSPVAIATVLPQRMWSGTALRAVGDAVRAPGFAAPNAALVRRSTAESTAGPVAGPVPVLELSARWMGRWARLVAGAPGWQRMALLAVAPQSVAPQSVAPQSVASPGTTTAVRSSERRAAEIVHRFRDAASPTAFRLACYLSAAWLNLPVMRLVQRVMLPDSETSHLAEVFLGGLLRAAGTAADPIGAETVQYEFLPGVRDELNDFLMRDEMLDVLRRTSEFIAERFGQALDFPALLADPEGAELPALGADGGGPPLAYVAAGVLAKLGGRYGVLADRLARPGDARPPTAAGEPGSGLAATGTDGSALPGGEVPDEAVPDEPVDEAVPDGRRYTAEHEWVRVDRPSVARIGITDYAQDAVADIVYVQLPEVGMELNAGDSFGEIESVKTVAELYAPVSGVVVARNDTLVDEPERMNADPYGEGWLIDIQMRDPAELYGLLTEADYVGLIARPDADTTPPDEPAVPESDFRLPDPARSRVLLIGCLEEPKPAGTRPVLTRLERDLRRLLAVLADPDLVGLDPRRCTLLLSPTEAEAAAALRRAAAEADDLLVVVVAGFSVPSHRGDVTFALRGRSRRWGTVDLAEVHQVVEDSRARVAGVVADAIGPEPGAVWVPRPGTRGEGGAIRFKAVRSGASYETSTTTLISRLAEVITRGVDGPEEAVPLEAVMDALRFHGAAVTVTGDVDTPFHLTRNAARTGRSATVTIPVWGLPPLSRPLVGRPDLVDSVVGTLLSSRSTDVVLTGMGGSGKTTIAALVARDPRISTAFPGGVFWVTVGESTGGSALTDRVGGLCAALVARTPAADTAARGESLPTLLAGLPPVMLVLDDVVDAAQVAAFPVAGTGCVRLIVTRNGGLAAKDAALLRVAEMSPDQAVELLSDAGVRGLSETTTAEIIDGTGRSPLLLSLAAAAVTVSVRTGLDPEMAGRRLVDSLRGHGVSGLSARSVVEAVMDVLPEPDRQRLMELAAFPSEAVPLAAVEGLWRDTARLDRAESRALCGRLGDAGLVEFDGATVAMHGLLRSSLRDRLGARVDGLERLIQRGTEY